MEPVVLDHGTYLIKAGYANPDNDPSLVFSSEMCRMDGKDPSQPNGINPGSGTKSALEGFDLVHPIRRGQIEDWDVMEDVWRYIFYSQLGWELGNEGQVLVAEPLGTSKMARERLTQVMFETFNCLGFYAVEQALLSLYAVGRLTGCTVDVGHGKLEIAPIIEGALQQTAVRRLDIGGLDLESLLQRQLAESQPQLRLDGSALRSVKESCCQVAADAEAYEASANECAPVHHKLPDGQTIVVGRERLAVGEALFCPELLGVEDCGLPDQMLRCVSLCSPLEVQKQVLDNVVLAGGTTLLSGFAERFMRDASSAAPPSLRPTLIKPPDYMPDDTGRNAAWMGGAILAKVVFPQNQHITKAEYDEMGPTIVHRKCF